MRFFAGVLRLAAGAILFGVIAVVFFREHCAPIRLLFSPTPSAAHNPAQAAGVANYSRPEVDTFYTYPEWYIVWSYQSKADFQQGHLPSGYSYFGDIGQFWQAYCRMYSATRAVYPFPIGDHVMLAVIGSSFSVEYALKGLYEKTIGRLSEWTSRHEPVAEDFYAAQVAENYAAFVHIRPFYEFSFAHALHGLWSETPFRTTHLLRTLERRAWLTLDYSVEALYCQLIELGTHATYGFEDTTTKAWVDLPPEVNPRPLAVSRLFGMLVGTRRSSRSPLPGIYPVSPDAHQGRCPVPSDCRQSAHRRFSHSAKPMDQPCAWGAGSSGAAVVDKSGKGARGVIVSGSGVAHGSAPGWRLTA